MVTSGIGSVVEIDARSGDRTSLKLDGLAQARWDNHLRMTNSPRPDRANAWGGSRPSGGKAFDAAFGAPGVNGTSEA